MFDSQPGFLVWPMCHLHAKFKIRPIHFMSFFFYHAATHCFAIMYLLQCHIMQVCYISVLLQAWCCKHDATTFFTSAIKFLYVKFTLNNFVLIKISEWFLSLFLFVCFFKNCPYILEQGYSKHLNISLTPTYVYKSLSGSRCLNINVFNLRV